MCTARAKIAEPYIQPFTLVYPGGEQRGGYTRISGEFSAAYRGGFLAGVLCFVGSTLAVHLAQLPNKTPLKYATPLSPWLPAFTTITGHSERHCQGRRGTQGRENADPNDHHRHDVRPAAGDGDICCRHAVKAETQEGLIRR